MSRRPWSSRFTTWAFAWLLVLKAAVPMLAAAAAHAQGVPVAEVCPIYGVALPGAPSTALALDAGMAPDAAAEHGAHAGDGSAGPDADAAGHPGHDRHGGHPGHGSHDGASQAGDHCALTALASMAMPDLALPPPPRAAAAVALPPAARCSVGPDACALWASRLKHGPPARA